MNCTFHMDECQIGFHGNMANGWSSVVVFVVCAPVNGDPIYSVSRIRRDLLLRIERWLLWRASVTVCSLQARNEHAEIVNDRHKSNTICAINSRLIIIEHRIIVNIFNIQQSKSCFTTQRNYLACTSISLLFKKNQLSEVKYIWLICGTVKWCMHAAPMRNANWRINYKQISMYMCTFSTFLPRRSSHHAKRPATMGTIVIGRARF